MRVSCLADWERKQGKEVLALRDVLVVLSWNIIPM